MNIARVNIEILLENQTATYFHRSRLFTYDTMKNFNLATFDRKKSIMTACMPFNNFNKRRVGAFSPPNSPYFLNVSQRSLKRLTIIHHICIHAICPSIKMKDIYLILTEVKYMISVLITIT